MTALALSEPASLARLLPGGPGGGYRADVDRYGPLPQTSREVMLELEASGLTGRGGAAFPTALKLATVSRQRRTQVVANAMEGEPASAKDKVLLTQNPHLVLDGLLLAAHLVRANEATLAVSETERSVIAAVGRAIEERPPAQRPTLAAVPRGFVSGEETALVAALAGRPAKPTGRRPYEDGVLEIARVARYMAAESAGQCGPCVFGLPATAAALEQVVRGHDTTRALARLDRLESQVSGRGGCAHPDGTLGFVSSGLAVFGDEVERHRHRECSALRRDPVLPIPAFARRAAA